MMKRTTCRITGEPLVPLFTLGDIYVSDFLEPDEVPDDNSKVELELALSPESGLVQLTSTADFDSMYKRYWYHSGINESMIKELGRIVESVTDTVKLSDDDVWIDIGCNDGTLMKAVPDNIRKIGVDPATNNCQAAKEYCEVYENYFTASLFPVDLNAKVITSIAMFYDLEDPNSFCQDIHSVLGDDGLWVIQLSYLPLMLDQLAFDNICHEHLEYYSLEAIKFLLERNGFKIVDAQLNDTNGGSVRVYAQKQEADMNSFATPPYRDVANMRIESLLTHEQTLDLKNPSVYIDFFNRIESLKEETVAFIEDVKSQGKVVWGYGASTKGNTLLQYFGLTNNHIDGIAERSESKFGLRTIGTNIPIYSESEMRKVDPDYMLVLPWHFISTFVQREQDYLDSGGKFIVPCPRFDVI